MPKPGNRKKRTMTVEEFDRDRKRAISAAGKPGGLWVVNEDGSPRFFICIPHAPLPDLS